jgi:hypothetical protein
MFHEPQNKNMSEEKLELYRKIDDVIIDDIINIKKNILIEFL